MTLTHIDPKGYPKMVNIANKAITHRRAIAAGYLSLCKECANALDRNIEPKGNPWMIAHIGAISGTKRAWDLIPLAHPISIDAINVEHYWDSVQLLAWIKVEVIVYGRTGVEMEALTGVSMGLLSLYDTLKAISHKMSISSIRLLLKEGGQSGIITQSWKECPWNI